MDAKTLAVKGLGLGLKYPFSNQGKVGVCESAKRIISAHLISSRLINLLRTIYGSCVRNR